MEIKDYGSSVQFNVDYLRLAELQYTEDFGSVLVINPRCMVYSNPKFFGGIDAIRPEYKKDFEYILKNARIDRYTVRR